MHLEDGRFLHFSIDTLFDTRHYRGTRQNVGVHRAIVARPVSMFSKQAQTAWNLGDIGVGLQAWINVIVLILLSREGFRMLREFEKKG